MKEFQNLTILYVKFSKFLGCRSLSVKSKSKVQVKVMLYVPTVYDASSFSLSGYFGSFLKVQT